MKEFIKKVVLLFATVLFLTGCLKRDNLEDVDIYTTVYPLQYVMDFLYGTNSNVKSIYPAETIPSEYTLTSKQVEEYSKGAMFVYNGLSNEKSITRDLKNANKNLIPIDATQGLEYNHYMEELWINPDNLLEIAHNIKNNLEENVKNKYIIEEIEKNYEDLKVLMSGFGVELQIDKKVSDTNILIGTDTLSFLASDRYGYDVINVDEEAGEVQSTTIAKAKKLISSKSIKYIYLLDNQEVSDTVKELEESGAEIIRLRSMTVLSEEDIQNNVTYKTMMRDNIEDIQKEIYE